MPKMVMAECMKLKRNSILGIVILGSFCSVGMAVLQLLGAEGSLRGFQELNDGVIWNNITLFFPALLTLMTGYSINREYIDDTLKNNLIIGVSYRKMVMAKLITCFLLTIIVAVTNFLLTIITSIILGYTFLALPINFLKIIVTSLGCYIAILPIVVFFSRKQNSYLGGVVLAFAIGICGIFVANTKFVNFYPLTASLSIIRYNQQVTVYRTDLGCLALIMALVISIIILMFGRNQDATST